MKVLLVLSLLCAVLVGVVGKHSHHRHHSNGQWTINPFQQSIMLSVAFGDETTAYIAGGQNGEGSNTLKSTDAGQTWSEVPIGQNTFMAMAVAANSPTSAIISGLAMATGAAQYTADGQKFQAANETGVLLETSQWAASIGGTQGKGYAIVGGFAVQGKGQFNGVAYSYDAGKTYQVSNCGNPEEARYGAFPSPNLWLITLGDWPNTTSDAVFPEQTIELTRSISIHTTHHKKRIQFTQPKYEPASNDGWYAAIMKSTDQGKTWTQTFVNTTFYFNQISCASESVCWAIGNNDDEMYLYVTKDGGNSWSQQYSAGQGAQGNAVFAVSESEVWLGGGIIGQFGVTGYAYHSVDGGNTFTVDKLADNMIFGLDFPSAKLGVAVTINSMQQSGIANYKA